MNNLVEEIEEILLMGPGPSNVPEPVYAALAQKTIGHLDPYFIRIMDEIKAQLQRLVKTSARLTLPASGTGSGAGRSAGTGSDGGAVGVGEGAGSAPDAHAPTRARMDRRDSRRGRMDTSGVSEGVVRNRLKGTSPEGSGSLLGRLAPVRCFSPADSASILKGPASNR